MKSWKWGEIGQALLALRDNGVAWRKDFSLIFVLWTCLNWEVTAPSSCATPLSWWHNHDVIMMCWWCHADPFLLPSSFLSLCLFHSFTIQLPPPSLPESSRSFQQALQTYKTKRDCIHTGMSLLLSFYREHFKVKVLSFYDEPGIVQHAHSFNS